MMAVKDKLRIVLDTNIIISSISTRSPYRQILDALFDGEYELYLTTEILLEFEEKIVQFFDKEVAENFLGALLLLPNVKKIETYFNFTIIEHDMDDNKFVDCAFAGNAHFLVTNDKHFNVLKNLSFPKVNVIKIDEFCQMLNG